jgi:hypothetical protein
VETDGTWPPRWKGSNFKRPHSRKVARGLQREKRDAREGTHKTAVRRRDRYCRFPLCGCRRFHLALHVSHQTHKGMGGNPREDRSTPDRMMLLCSARHKENSVSIDRGTLRWRALTKDGAAGPVAWEVQHHERWAGSPWRQKWVEVARETAVQSIEPPVAWQFAILQQLAKMEM